MPLLNYRWCYVDSNLTYDPDVNTCYAYYWGDRDLFKIFGYIVNILQYDTKGRGDIQLDMFSCVVPLVKFYYMLVSKAAIVLTYFPRSNSSLSPSLLQSPTLRYICYTLPLWIGLIGRCVGKGYAYRVGNSSKDVWPWVSLLLLAAFTALQVLWDEDDVINYLPVVLLICSVILVVDRLCGGRSSCCCAPREKRVYPHPHLAHVLLTQFALIFGPHYLAKSSFKLITDAEQRLDVFSNVFKENDTREMAEKFTFYIVYLCLSSFLMLVIDVLAEWIMPNNTVLVKRLQLVVSFTEYLFIQAIIPSVTPIGGIFFAFLVFTFVKEIVLRTATHIRLFMWIYEWMTRYSCVKKIATCLHISDLKDMMSDMTQTESMVELFFVNELKSFSANAAGWVVLSSMMIELLANYFRAGAAKCDEVFFFLTAANSQDVPRMIANNVFIMIAIGLAQMVTIMVWEARFEASKLQILDARIKKVYSNMAHKISERETRKNMRRMGGSTRGEGKGEEEMAGMARHLSSPAGLRTGGPAGWGGEAEG